LYTTLTKTIFSNNLRTILGYIQLWSLNMFEPGTRKQEQEGKASKDQL